ncbi:hypothetical protein Leryth_001852 [Lithospermum erythrorhizon]|nr:hypothetical protein Leryth_001852 [Lithospermum erythrorhizon]
MVAEPWILKLGNQVSKNFKNALHMENSKNLYSSGKKQAQEKKIIGILSFEIANVMSKIIHLHTFLTDKEISALKNEILKSVGIKTLVSDDENMLLELVVKEKLEDLNRVASVVSRLGKKCTIPALQGFEHVYGDIVSRKINVRELGFLVKDMDGMVRKLERPHVGPHRSEGGLFGPDDFNFACGIGPGRLFMECLSLSSSASKVEDDNDDVGYDDQSSQISGCFSVTSGAKREQPDLSGFFDQSLSRQSNGATTNVSKLGTKSRILVHASPNTVGGSALALHYANIIIVIEKLLRYPHLVGEEARDDLYQMLPISVRKTLKTRLRSYVKSLAIYDAPLAHDWKAKIEVVLQGIAPLAHNMIRWQSERNFEQHQIVKRTNVLLIQTLYFADRKKTEDAICEVLVGLNYVCRYEQQQNALLDCTSSFDLEENMDWQMEFCSPLHS